jgi:hypothetical protein
MQALLGNTGAHVLAAGPIKDSVERLCFHLVETTVPDDFLEWSVSVTPFAHGRFAEYYFSLHKVDACQQFTRRHRQRA